MSETLHECERCKATFYYAPETHRCAGEWETIAGSIANPHAGLSWVDECMTKVGAR